MVGLFATVVVLGFLNNAPSKDLVRHHAFGEGRGALGEGVSMGKSDQRSAVLIGAMIALIILVLFVLSLSAVLVVQSMSGGVTRIPAPGGQVAVLFTASPVLSETAVLPSRPAT